MHGRRDSFAPTGKELSKWGVGEGSGGERGVAPSLPVFICFAVKDC